MKFQFKHQQFQADATSSICEIFRGQRRQTESFTLNPTATLTFNHRGKNFTKKITRKISSGDDLFALSGGMEEYRNFIAAVIDGAANSIEFLNVLKLFAGQVVGDASEELFRRIQIRETIQSHPERESQLFVAA